MEDQGKRLLVAVAVAFGLMLLWTFLFPAKHVPKKKPPVKPEVSQKAPQPGAHRGTAETPRAPGKAAKPEAAAPEKAPQPARPRGKEQIFDFHFAKFDAKFSSYGGTLSSWKLTDKRYRDAHGRLLDLVPQFGERSRDFQVAFDKSTETIPAGAEWKGKRLNDREVEFTWSSPDLRVVKRFKLYPDDYLVRLTVEVTRTGGGEAKQALSITQYGFQNPKAKTGGHMHRISLEWKAACDVDGSVDTKKAKDLSTVPWVESGKIKWGGFAHGFFLAAASPQAGQEQRMACEATAVPETPGLMRSSLVYPPIALKAGDPTYSRTVTGYYGPKYLDKLDGISRVVGYETGFRDAIDLGFLAIIARPLLWLLIWFQSFVVNWGIAIILLTVVVKLVTLHWTNKSTRSMREMAKLKPDIEKLQKKYKDDKQRLQQEMMNLYKAHGVNPLSGCLPMLLQMPIWFALYKTLEVAAELYKAPFIPGWINDLTAADPYYVLPVLLTAMMFFQTRFTPTTGDSTQQKLMQYGMPIMFGGFSLFFPSGLTLYIATSTGLNVVQQMWIKARDIKREGKGPGGKGPSGKGPSGKGPDGKGPDGKGPSGKGPEASKGEVEAEAGKGAKGKGESAEGPAREEAAQPAGKTPSGAQGGRPRSKGGSKKRGGKRKRGHS